uniref:Uncharacterized protein n=1 Tax=Podoviridae sp. ct8Lf7 TaxID=2827723 RepID=A0A8S5S1H4_9CAUD|nr:MAG TPA: hypothetical protein [Podoviridae sp. ct8Lf7]
MDAFILSNVTILSGFIILSLGKVSLFPVLSLKIG